MKTCSNCGEPVASPFCPKCGNATPQQSSEAWRDNPPAVAPVPPMASQPQTVEAARQAARRRRWVKPVAIVAYLTLLVGAGVGAFLVLAPGQTATSATDSNDKTPERNDRPAAPETVTVEGSMNLDGVWGFYDSETISKYGKSCSGAGGFDDLTEGATVTVYDEAGAIVGVGGLTDGTIEPGAYSSGGNGAGTCQFDFTIPDVAPADFYQVEVSHRGKVTIPRAQAGTILLTLSGN